jgi:uncharacterized protein YjfI (DUF2170 family)
MNEESCNVSQVHSEASFDSQILRSKKTLDATHRGATSVHDVNYVGKNGQSHSKIYDY